MPLSSLRLRDFGFLADCQKTDGFIIPIFDFDFPKIKNWFCPYPCYCPP